MGDDENANQRLKVCFVNWLMALNAEEKRMFRMASYRRRAPGIAQEVAEEFILHDETHASALDKSGDKFSYWLEANRSVLLPSFEASVDKDFAEYAARLPCIPM